MKLNKRKTTIFLAIYILIALVVRFYIEPKLGVSYVQSISIGIATIVPVWLLFKVKFLTLKGINEE